MIASLLLFQTAKLNFGPIVIFDPVTLPESSLLSNEVLKELKLNRDAIQNKRDALQAKFHNQSIPKRVAAVNKLIRDLYGSLKADQKNRYLQLVRQGYGPTILLCPKVPQPFQLSPAQLKLFRGSVVRLSAEYQSQAYAAMKKRASKGELGNLALTYEGKIDLALVGTLTPDQNSKWTASLGAPSRLVKRSGCLSLVSPTG